MRESFVATNLVLQPQSEMGGPRLSAIQIARMLFLPALMALVALATARVHYLLFHTTAEFISIIIALTALVVSSTSRTFTRNHFTVYVAVVMGWSAIMDLFHALSYQGMGLLDAVVPPENYPATQAWVLARVIQSGALLLAPLFLNRSFRISYLHLVLASLVTGSLVWVISGTFPQVFVPGQGLTPFKVYTEYLIIGLLLAASSFLWLRRRQVSPIVFLNVQAALMLMVVTEFSFTLYVSMYGPSNAVGHIAKIFSAWFIYRALIERTLIDPFSMLSRTASTYDAVPDPAVVVDPSGQIQQANQAAALRSNLPAEDLVGRSVHTLFHDPASTAADCPVCIRMARGEDTFTVELDVSEPAHSVECTVAPFVEGSGLGPRYVQVIRDVTERKQLMRERERLLSDLTERVKETRTQYAISEVLNQPGLDIPGMLKQVVAVLPQGFQLPAQVRATITSDWGTFGEEGCGCVSHALQQEIRVGPKTVGEILVFYVPVLTSGDDPFLPEEREMMRTVAQRVGSAIEQRQAAVQIQRLTYFYDMLSATNRAIVHCRSDQELLARVFEALILHGTFPMLYIAFGDPEVKSWQLIHVHGIADDRLEQLRELLVDPQGPMAAMLPDLHQGKVVWLPISQGGRHAGWLDYLSVHGIVDRAALPLMREGQLVGCVVLLTHRTGTFDLPQVKLLQEMTEDLAFALDSIAQNERRQAAESRAEISELRFQEVFDASPTPMQILSITSGEMRAINRAYQQWLGYERGELATLEGWFSLVYPDPVMREQLRSHWARAIDRARMSHSPVHSPELRLRCKDGSDRIAVGTVTLVGDDAVLAWTDLTEIRRSEEALRASEEHFRTMIEQAVTGIYVRRDGRFIYVNPRYCDMLGWTREELLGQEIWDFTEKTPENIQRIKAAWSRLDAGEDRVEYIVPVRSKSGEMLELQLTARTIQWDAQPATIVMATDVTERKRAEAQIASYVQQLEISMRGTLQAVANMIDRRDPYTAGHERRVGLISRAIAAEMGWSVQRCEMMELTGLVHDIGKIGVPAEILSKPGRLSPIEMELVRGHAQTGFEILKDVPFNFPVAEIIYQHHERLDGSGYPRGFKGEAILPEARVLAVADVLESMASHRPYRPALGLEFALAELEQGRGTHYDPVVVDAALRMIRDKGYVLPQ